MKAVSQGGILLWRLTWRSLKRDALSSLMLVLFVALAAMLASAATIVLLTGGTAVRSLMDRALTPDFLQMHSGQLDLPRFEAFASTNPQVERFEAVNMLNFDGTSLRVGGASLATGLQDNAFVVQSDSFDHLLAPDGQVIRPSVSTVWLPVYYMELLGLEVGQTLEVHGEAGNLDLEIAGFLQDSQMNSSFASSKRLLVHPDDFERLAHLGGEYEYLLQFRLNDAAKVGEFEAAYRAAGLEANGPTLTRSLFVLVNSLDPVLSGAVVVMVALLLTAMAVLCVRFVLLTGMERNYREIGVLAALGVRTEQLRRLYGVRFLPLALASALVGWLVSPLLSRVLLRDVQLYMGPVQGGVMPWLFGLVAALAIALLLMLAVRRVLRRIGAVSPVRAIRSGTSAAGHVRQPAWPGLPSGRWRLRLALGIRDLLARRSIYVVPFVVFCLAAIIMVVPQNLHTTVSRPEFITYLGAGLSDVRVEVPAGEDSIGQLKAALAADAAVARHADFITAAYDFVDSDGRVHNLKVESGDHQAFPVAYLAGGAPVGTDDLALSTLLAAELGLETGSALELDGRRFTVSGIYQDVTNGGRTAKMAAAPFSRRVLWGTVLIDAAHDAAVGDLVAKYSGDWPGLQFSSVADYVDTIMGGTRTALKAVTFTTTLAGLVVAALITGLFMPLLLARDSAAIGLQFALGFRRSDITGQYLARAVLLLVPAIAVGSLLANFLGGSIAGVLLGPLGLSQVRLAVDPLLAWLLAPAALLAAVLLASAVSVRPRPAMFLNQALKEGQ